jgi:hypothetical protein
MFGYTWHGLRSYRIDYRGGVEVIHRFGLDKVRAATTSFPYDELLNPNVVLFSHSVIVKTRRDVGQNTRVEAERAAKLHCYMAVYLARNCPMCRNTLG